MKTNTTKTVLLAGIAIAATAASSFAEARGGFLWTKGGRVKNIKVGDGISDAFTVFPRQVQGQNFTFVITDPDTNILAFRKDNTFDLEGAPEGTCLVYGIAYDGELTQTTGVPLHSLTATEGLAFSKNHITINRTAVDVVDGGWIIPDGRGRSRIRINLDQPYPIRAYSANNAAPNSNYAYIITDDQGVILAFPPANQFDFSGAPEGTCRIYGVSYTGELNTITGIPVSEALSTGEELELSKNYIEVIRYRR